MPRQDAEELLSLGGGLQIKVVPPGDAFRIAGLECCFADRPILGHEIADERMAHHVVGEIELLRDPGPVLLQVRDNDRESLDGIGPPGDN